MGYNQGGRASHYFCLTVLPVHRCELPSPLNSRHGLPLADFVLLSFLGSAVMIRALNGSTSRALASHLWFIVLMLVCVGDGLLTANEPSARLSWTNDVMPVFTKAGCNAGVCHAKAGGGQNGFQLSLLGFEPKEDYEHLVKEGRGRRLFPGAPEKSLLLLKGAGQLPHGGGVRLPVGSEGYEVLREWIRQGMPYDSESEKKMVALEVTPSSGSMAKHGQQRLEAIARYSDGSSRDVTKLALFESNDKAMAEVDAEGLVTASDLPGNVAIMVRFLGSVAVFNASIPQGGPVDRLPASKSFVDDHVFENLRKLGIPPSELCDDATFIRRVSLDIAGRLPTEKEVSEFLSTKIRRSESDG